MLNEQINAKLAAVEASHSELSTASTKYQVEISRLSKERDSWLLEANRLKKEQEDARRGSLIEENLYRVTTLELEPDEDDINKL